MKSLLLTFVFILLSIAQSPIFANSSKPSYKYRIEGFGGLSSVNPTDLNTARQNFIWNGNSASSGTFSKLMYAGGSIGKRLKSHLLVSIRYEQEFQALPKTDVGSGSTVADYFLYHPVLLMMEFPFEGKHWSFSFGGGIGYSLKYEYHQQYSGTQEDITYAAHPLVFRGRVTLGYALGKHFVLFLEANYDKVSAPELKAIQNYQATVNSSTISSGQSFYDASGSSPAKADLRGLRYGGGVRLVF